MFWLKLIKDIVAIFREGQTPRQVAGGFMLGSIVGLSPAMTLQGLIVWLLILLFDVNIGAAVLALTFCSLCAYLLDPFFHWLGYQILVNIEGLRGFWTALYNLPVAPLTRFNNTVVMGSFVVALALAAPVYFGFKHLVITYRRTIGARIEKLRIYKVLKQSRFIQLYMRIRNLGE